ncbi:MAG TPA: hypothetical protein VMX13_13030 [Sedimentisphaerales bacterium]|nr:hypothetical protein [Sedimentisphaerales bacterium]
MAQIIFTPGEAVNMLMANDLLPEVITDIKVSDDTLVLNVATPLPLVDSLPVSIKYLGFKEGRLELEVSVPILKGKMLETVVHLVQGTLERRFHEQIQLDYPRLYVHINRLLVAKNIRSVEVREITFERGFFEIMVVAP